MAEQCQNFDTARPRPSSVKIFFSNFDTARPWPSSVTARPRPSSVKIFFSNFDTARPRPSSVKIFFSNFDTARPWPSSVKILTLLGRGRGKYSCQGHGSICQVVTCFQLYVSLAPEH